MPTSGGAPIFLLGFGTGTLVGTTDVSDPDANKVFEITLTPDGSVEGNDLYSIEMFASIDNGGSITFEDFSEAPAGQNAWIGIDDPRAGAENQNEDLLFTGADPDDVGDPDTVNTNSFAVGSNSQAISVGEVLRLDYVRNINILDGDSKDLGTLTYDEHYDVNKASFTIIQTGGPRTNPVDALVKVYDADDDLIFDNDDGSTGNPTADVQDTIISVSIYDDSGVLVGTFTSDDTHVDFLGDGSVLVKDIFEGYEVFVSTADGFNRMEITNYTSEGKKNDSFDLGGFELTSVDAGDPVLLSFDLEVSDQDGDLALGTLDVMLSPVVEGTDGPDTLAGSVDVEIFVGGLGDDLLVGNGGNDIFVYAFDSIDPTSVVGVDGSDTIADMSAGDTLRFDDLADNVSVIAGLESAVTVSDNGVDTTITFEPGGATITLLEVSLGGMLDSSLADLNDAGYNIEIM